MLSMLFLFGVSLLFVQCEEEALLNEIMAEETIDTRGFTSPSTMDICDCIAQNFPVEELSSKEKEALKFMLEEEKLARDVYSAMAEKYNLKIFSNIVNAEEKHMASVKCLINKYGLTDPIGQNEKGVFTNGQFQDLYASLVTRGNTGLTEALRVGATIEDLDINDLTLLLEDEAIDNTDLKAVFEALRKGSRNHMRAFTRNLNSYGEEYEVQYITEDMFTTIIEGEQERGNGVCAKWIDCPNADNTGNCKNTCNGANQMNGKKGNNNGINCQGKKANQNCDGSGAVKNSKGKKGNNGN